MRIFIFLCSIFLSFSLSAKEITTFQDLFEYLGPKNPLVIDVNKSSNVVENIDGKLIYKSAYFNSNPTVSSIVENGDYYSIKINTDVLYNPYNIFYQFSLNNAIGTIEFNYLQGEIVRIDVINSFEKRNFKDKELKELRELIQSKLLNMGFVETSNDSPLNKIFGKNESTVYVKDDFVVAISKVYRKSSIVTSIYNKDYSNQMVKIDGMISKKEQDKNKEKINIFYK